MESDANFPHIFRYNPIPPPHDLPEVIRFGRPSDLTIQTETSCCLDHNPKLARGVSIPTCRTREGPTNRGTIVIRRFPSPPKFERTGLSCGNSVARQRASVGDPLNDEEWCDHLSDPTSVASHETTGPEIVVVGRHEPESLQGSGRRYSQRSVRLRKHPGYRRLSPRPTLQQPPTSSRQKGHKTQ